MRHIFYITFLTSILLFGSVKEGPFTINNYATAIMAIALLINFQKIKIFLKNINLNLYIIFAVTFFITLLINNEISDFNSTTYFFGRVLPCIVAFIAVAFYIKSKREFLVVCSLLIVISIFNNILTILQFYGNELGYRFSSFFTILEQTESFEMDARFFRTLGRIKIEGIWGNVVRNGLMVSSLFALPMVFYNKRNINKIFVFSTLSLSIYAIYVIQQRTAFLLAVLCFALIIFRYINLKKLILYSITLLIISLLLYSSFFSIELGRFSDIQDSGRIILYKTAWAWISENLITGGPYKFGKYLYANLGGTDPHNFFLSALVYGGIIGGSFIIVLFFRIISLCIKNIYHSIGKDHKYNKGVFIISLVMMVALLNGLTHNNSLVYGYSYLWIFYALLLRSKQLGL